MMQRVRGGEFDFSAAPYFGLAYKEDLRYNRIIIPINLYTEFMLKTIILEKDRAYAENALV